MIPRYQAVLFAILILASAIMGIALWQMRDHAHQQLLTGEDTAPTQAPTVNPSEQATLLVANDKDGALDTQLETLPLPSDPGSRARALLGKLLDLYAAPNAQHPVAGGAQAIAQVFLLPAHIEPPKSDPLAAPASSSATAPKAPTQQIVTPTTGGSTGQAMLAVVNLSGSFAQNHPSGIATETLTLLSICGTLHANLPDVVQVRFLVDGQPRATLAGHADLTRVYLAGDIQSATGVHP